MPNSLVQIWEVRWLRSWVVNSFTGMVHKRTKIDIATTIRRACGSRLYISARLNLKNEFVFLLRTLHLINSDVLIKCKVRRLRGIFLLLSS